MASVLSQINLPQNIGYALALSARHFHEEKHVSLCFIVQLIVVKESQHGKQDLKKMFIFALHYYFSQRISLFLQLMGPSKINSKVFFFIYRLILVIAKMPYRETHAHNIRSRQLQIVINLFENLVSINYFNINMQYSQMLF